MSPELLDPRRFYPCGKVKPQPVTLTENLNHYIECDDSRCKARIEKYREIASQVRGALR